MSIANLKADISRIVHRAGSILVRLNGSGVYYSVGIASGTVCRISDISTKPDENGQQRQVACRVDISSTLLQTALGTELSAIVSLVGQKLDVLLTSRPASAPSYTSVDALALAEIKVFGAYMRAGAVLQYDGRASTMPVEVGFTVPIDNFTTLLTTGFTL